MADAINAPPAHGERSTLGTAGGREPKLSETTATTPLTTTTSDGELGAGATGSGDLPPAA